jgi:signal transduction histidine kinase
VLARSERGLDQQQPIDLAHATKQIVQSHQADADRLNLRVDTDLQSSGINGDTRLIDRLLTNLVTNSVNHNSAGGHIEIACGTTAGGDAFIRVTNSGPVLDAAVLPRLLQPFQRGHTDPTSHSNGHGLGLSIVHAIAAAHGATLLADAPPTGGLDIRVEFPTARRDLPALQDIARR